MNAAIPERRPATEEISGLIERVTFHNDESGFCVLRVKARGQREETTVVGSLPSVTAGEWQVCGFAAFRNRVTLLGYSEYFAHVRFLALRLRRRSSAPLPATHGAWRRYQGSSYRPGICGCEPALSSGQVRGS